MRKSINTPHPVSFKKRKLNGYTNCSLKFGNVGLKLDKNYTIEKLYITALKKRLKFFLKKKTKLKQQTWFFLMENTPVFKKGKNARMGKGKGIYQRMVFRVKKHKTLLEFFNINLLFLNKVSVFFKNTFNVHNSVVGNNKYNLNQGNKTLTYYKLYNRF